MKYPKINTIWKRDENDDFRIIEGDYSKFEFTTIKEWHIEAVQQLAHLNIKSVQLIDLFLFYPLIKL